MAKKGMLDLLRGYVESDVDHNGKKFYVGTVTGSSTNSSFTRIGKIVGSIGEKLTVLLSYTKSNIYGIFFILFGILSLIISFIKAYVGMYPDGIPIYTIVIGAILTVLGIPFLISEKPLAIAVQDFEPTDFIFFEFFCIRRMHRNEKEKGLHFVFGIIFGVLFAALGAVVPLWTVVAAIGVFVYLFLTFLSPEFSFFSIFLVMPYLSFDSEGIFLAVMVAITMISYARKVALGKRVYFFEQYDLFLGVMLLCILISGIFVKGVDSFVSSVVMILLGMGYVMASSLVTNRRLSECLINAVIISSVPVSLIAITETVVYAYKDGLSGFEGASATFDKPNTLAIFLLISAVFSIYFVNTKRTKSAKTVYLIIFLITFVSLLCTLSVWVFVAALFGLIAFGVLKLRRGWRALIFLLVLLPYGLLFVPDKYIQMAIEHPIVSALGFSAPMSAWDSSIKMLLDNLLMGVGIGEVSFAEEILNYAPYSGFVNSGNFLLEIACEAGIISLAAFLLILVVRLRHRAIYRPYIKNSQVSSLSEITSVAVVMFMIYGVFNYIWSDMTMYYLFWCVFGLGSAALRISKQEFDDRVAYFSDGSAEDSSSIDITIR